MQTLPLREDVKQLNKDIYKSNTARQAINVIRESNAFKYCLTKQEKTIFRWFITRNWKVEEATLHPNDVELALYVVVLCNTQYMDILLKAIDKREYYWAPIVAKYLQTERRLVLDNVV